MERPTLLVCGKCARVFGRKDLDDAWLIKPDIRFDPKHEVWVVRCPQHAWEEWPLRCSGSRSKKLVKKYFYAMLEDDERMPRPPGWNPYIDPIPVPKDSNA